MKTLLLQHRQRIPLWLDDVREAFPVLVEEFKADIAAVSPFLRELAGPVTVRVERQEGKRRATWLAESTINLVSVIAQLSAKRDCPTTRTWNYLETRSWTNQECEGVRLDPQHNS